MDTLHWWHATLHTRRMFALLHSHSLRLGLKHTVIGMFCFCFAGCWVGGTNLAGYMSTNPSVNLGFYGPAIPTGTVLMCNTAAGYTGSNVTCSSGGKLSSGNCSKTG